MVGSLLLRGMLVGVIAAVVAFGFAKVFGEPQPEAIPCEEQMDRAKGGSCGPEIVGRPAQAGLGLFTGVVVYSAAQESLFSLAFAVVYGRFARLGLRSTAALLAFGGFVSIVLVPDLKCPVNPPSIENPETIGSRTALFFAMIVISAVALILAISLARSLVTRHDRWNAALFGGATYAVIIGVAQYALPAINEVPEQPSAVVLWHFRIASLRIHAVLRIIIGLLFGTLTERAFAQGGSGRLTAT